LASGTEAPWAWPVGTAVLLSVVLVGGAILALRRREL